MFIIGIAGGTGSGKTTVVKKLIERLPKGEVVVIPQDSYYKDSSDVPAEERQNINFDHPDAFEWPLLAKHIEQLKQGHAVRLPHWKPDVRIKMQPPDEHSKMTAPYLYVESRFGRVPWVITQVELLSCSWEIALEPQA